MKVLRRIAILFTLFMLLVLCIFLYLNRQFSFVQRDLLSYNEALHQIQAEILAGTTESEIEEKYNCRIILSTEINDSELAEVYRNSAFVLDLAPNGEYMGKVAWLDEQNRYNSAKDGFFFVSLILCVLLLLCGYLMLLGFFLSLIRPVQELQHFSESIAKGNLEAPLPIHKNNIFGNFVEAFDLMREQLIAARTREIAAEKARKELVTELSHDIKTPVSVIKATCEVLEAKYSLESKQDPDMLSKLSTISQKADTVSQLINNMMHANLEDLEQLEVTPAEESSLMIIDFIDNIKHYENILLDNEIPGCLVYMDRLRMEQAIDNVVGNSCKYAGTDIHVSFDTCSVETAMDGAVSGIKAEFLRIRIKDEGPGVSEDELPLITEKYYRGSNAAKIAGSGLGFYLVKYYMEKQGGGLEYYNDNGFTVELLLRKV
ncbi:MAG: HAMP domain-containing histidine kinase [Lachnospiraceae bacterium]|nr:HAMP domain-containing histidine kinase [Lachnospiraceae bacterium]